MEQSLAFDLRKTNKVLQHLLLCPWCCRDGHCSVICTSSSLSIFHLCSSSDHRAACPDFFAFSNVKKKSQRLHWRPLCQCLPPPCHHGSDFPLCQESWVVSALWADGALHSEMPKEVIRERLKQWRARSWYLALTLLSRIIIILLLPLRWAKYKPGLSLVKFCP